ncbi:CinA family protein [Streptomyces albus]|uniref:Nicotinamide-nucleotide amidohydrolase family protein n=1 Tax=Streptomyces albus TaxID=1888 RepID=A0A6C1C8Z7_9ACTN|nr:MULTISPECIES: nicotinamide-nucleotide amidohydrolase family protein [Streptomyces]KPC83870.1 damage-inducible protein CinA [Streptomyces sp. NRRL F-6602]MDI6413279.1 nicotinamide-nucleotide amidohydrolase family protein [Streptomyces albus]QID38521.1 nicotinamide-nucleotide amidohydrolase family protein [Streptomyces albus]TGG80283.1 nicotinamide-nucleotide amidohydrolase family protein [Streptomyces albus]UVN54484.1 nicotinamide-nucleotide amidohydrolase family protein [Streptomyces albus]
MTDVASRAGGVLALLTERGQTLAVAESLTGGLVAAEITAVPGASRSFLGSVTAYATALKRDVLGVDGALLEERGAVDAEVARQMARGVRTALGAHWGLSTTGVAGPQPQDGQPVGTVYVAVAGPDGEAAAELLRLDGGRGGDRAGDTGEEAGERVRAGIRTESVRGALELLYKKLIENAGGQDREQTGGNGCLQP